ncbi:SDR family NAD(P)-dependent oxidoreductase [Halorubrum lacusprofundi]|jgi:3-oxoacyl-[acyl-carrier protein] reductase|uniref:Short-chain dehydrogenase/reductase SDR n=1 Tax=Halorubrum lacusprofundi (strain ATCC 49239 / DSM 5036 / JCM 8891 / ACAM 34) TaxID=416348 RepID=B9LRK5_HALLT|nr:SDR family oxidoreductase [Halorubrum lacusprofundi]ACM55828.1 short-chain dehydrogenase/reductase SDR [Halorubrum lacusprofundi ATCC 49239]MCG1006697.1 SDR family oxidoreductase [Halorubrum lacusprofundi]
MTEDTTLTPDDSLPDLTGRVAVVTGGGRGIGRAITLGMAAAGATVVPSARTAAEVEAVADEARDFGVEARGITADVTDDDDVEALVEEIVDAFGSLDILVNNAGFNPGDALGDPAEIESDAVDSVLDVNLRGAFRTLRAAGPHLKEAGGSVVNVASVAGEVGLPKQHPYVASKHGLVGLTKSAAMDWAPEVRVNAVAPGYVATDLTETLQENERLRQSILDRTPLDRFADPMEIAGPAVFLASDAASFVTGETLAADGGWTAR